MNAIVCSYCGRDAALVNGLAIYPHRRDLHEKRFWSCTPCGAYVGTHPGTTRPLGRLADAELRAAKVAAHAAFDPLWGREKGAKRARAYAWLAEQLGIDGADCHIGMFDVATCRRVIELCQRNEITLRVVE